MDNFHPLKVVGRGSETQLQVGKNLNYLRVKLRHFIKSVNFHSPWDENHNIVSFVAHSTIHQPLYTYYYCVNIFLQQQGIFAGSYSAHTHSEC